MSVSEPTVVDWKSFCREVCVDRLVKDSKEELGGVGMIVEIDETIRGHRDKIAGERFPRCVIYDLVEDTKEEDVQQALANATDAEAEDFKISFKMRGKGGKSHFVVAAIPSLILALLEVKKITINWMKHNIREHLHIKTNNDLSAGSKSKYEWILSKITSPHHL
ncbi:hypothetical protein AVEN_10400-1 [Araneus ventricosus]|uniref:Uncharacterized protein n=1 Tax=Araneus ventricosus TaxID=182803 RepID=A0A4Y2M556_ARAVE|nr:hypothetical protein AVEN_10400-1 [Araneus ventricosus]